LLLPIDSANSLTALQNLRPSSPPTCFSVSIRSPVAVGQGDPVLIEEDPPEGFGALRGYAAQHLEIGALVFGSGIAEVPAAETSAACPGVVSTNCRSFGQT
jgi:hypothetical protein